MLKINIEHYWKVKEERKRLGMIVANDMEIPHPDLIGKKFLNKETNNIYTVEKITHDWYMGGYIIGALMEQNGSHGHYYIENRGCIMEHVNDSVERFWDKFILID